MTRRSLVTAWQAGQDVLAATGHQPDGRPAVVLAGTAALLAGLPALLLAVLPVHPTVRAAGRAWALGAAAYTLLSVARLVPVSRHEAYLAVLAVLALSGGLLLRLPRRRRDPGRAGADVPALAAAGGGGLVSLMPWLWLGALGGLLETVLAAVAAAAIGWLAAGILSPGFFAVYADRRRPGGARPVLAGGAVAGVTLALVAGGAGQPGPALVSPALAIAGFTLAALQPLLSRPATGSAPTALLIGIAVFGPLAFLGPEEVTVMLHGRDVPYWTQVAGVATLGVGASLGLGYGLLFGRRRTRRPSGRLAAGCAGVVLIVAGAVHLGPGQPGLHGDRLFVVLTEQADLSGVDTRRTGQAGRDARVREVHRILLAHAERTQVDLRAALDRGHVRYTSYYLVNAIEVDGGPAVRAWLRRRGDVAAVLDSPRPRPLPATIPVETGAESAPAGTPWDIAAIGADRVARELGVTGAGIVIGASDSGADGGHPALADGFRGGRDSWYDPWNHATTPVDHGGHGTHTLASAVGRTGTGVAPGARWAGCVNLHRNLGSPARYLDCLQFMLAPFPAGGDRFTDGNPARAPHVLTISWGCPAVEGCEADTFADATAALATAGIMLVASAGNTGPACGTVTDPPALYPDVVTVGATDESGTVAAFSSRGPTSAGRAKPDLVAPGAEVLSALPGGTYGTMSGTSMAAPHVAGVVALLWSAAPDLIGDLPATRSLLTSTATAVPAEPTCGATSAPAAGAGQVDAYAAVMAYRRSTTAGPGRG
ncbi:S8 family serine peptidase [Actinoplanes sp. NPDC049802]|uniref:S8 family serine peptidase n=1 Tax=Actinoplanes sp. NPDC049802 TaxID=3154742 RepID=UPI0033E05729